MNSRYASRKFLVSLLTLAITTWTRFELLIDSADFTKIVIAVIGLYGIANVAQKVMVKDAPEK